MSRTRRRCLLLGLTSTALALTGALPAHAAASPVQASPLAGVQTDGRVTDILTVGRTTYLAGMFTHVRPPGAAAGTQLVARSYLAAVDSVTGALRPWHPVADKAVYTLAASPDGGTIYLGGNFGSVGGAPRKHLAAVSAATGAVTGFRADTSGQVKALATARGRVYLGGDFTSVAGKPRNRLAAVTTRGAVVPGWHPAANNDVLDVQVSPDGSSVYAGGDFTAVDGNPAQRRLVKLAASTGAAEPWASHPGYPVVSIVVTPGRVYVGGNGSGGHAGSYSPSGVAGWVTQTDGGVQAIALKNGVLYVGGHFDTVCVGNTGGPVSHFECPTAKTVRHKLVAVAAGSGETLAWDPGANSALGVFALDPVGSRLRVGGEFTVIGGRAQQGLAAFGT